MADRAKRRRINVKSVTNGDGSASAAFTGGLGPPFLPAKAEDRLNWAGWCEIESEPALFSVMLREFGVKDVKVQEVFTMDEEVLAGLNKPVHGLIFLFRWREDDPDKQEASCPEEVWFANQTNSNACATIALLNIVNNIPSIDLGENLENFKQFTKDFTPALRGYSIGNFEFARQIHNSFARKMDMFNIDMALRNEATAKAQRGRQGGENTDEAGFHFIALVPIGDHVWKLDGLERQPQRLGKIGNQDWLDLATPVIQEMMMRYTSDEEQFVLLAVVQDPLKTLRPQLAENIAALNEAGMRLGEIAPDWREHETQNGTGDNTEGTIFGSDATYGITADMIQGAPVKGTAVAERLRSDNAEEIMSFRNGLAQEQRIIRAEMRSEEQTQAEEAEKAASRRHDYGATVQTWLKMLFRKGELQPLLEELDLQQHH